MSIQVLNNFSRGSYFTPFIFGVALAGLSCISNPCSNGICIDDLNSTYSCYCIDGFTGIQCQTNWDECWSSPCLNGGSCVDGIADYNCTCAEGFVGDNCEINYDECDSNPCQNNGTCIDLTNGYLCSCLPGYNGDYCEIDVAVCNNSEETRCANGGQCIEGPGYKFTCKCFPGWTGHRCEESIDECQSSPCLNGGVCIDAHADYMCACIFGYTGKNCEVEIEFCTENFCSNNALCVVENNVRVCYCVPDYHGERCQFQYDECQLEPRCMNGGTCIDGVDNFTCSCPPALTGILCECLLLDDGNEDCDYISPTPFLLTNTSTDTTPLYTSTPLTTVSSIFTTLHITDNTITSTLPTTVKNITTHKVSSYMTPLWSEATTVTVTSILDNVTITGLDETSPSTELISITSFRNNSETQPTMYPITESTTAYATVAEISTKSIDINSQQTCSDTMCADTTKTYVGEATQTTIKATTDYIMENYTSMTMLPEKPTLTVTIDEVTSVPTTSTANTQETISIDKTIPQISTVSLDSETENFFTEKPVTILSTSTGYQNFTTLSVVTDSKSTTVTDTKKTTMTDTAFTVTDTIFTVTDMTKIPVTVQMKTPVTDTTMTPIEVTMKTLFTDTTKSPVDTTMTTVQISMMTPVFDTTKTLVTDTKKNAVTETTKSTITDTTITTETIMTTATNIYYDNSSITMFPILPDCLDNSCMNGGTCINTPLGFKCICLFNYDGDLCEDHIGVETAAFNGNSHLSHKLSNTSSVHVAFTARTLLSEGILMFVDIDQGVYMQLYMDMGLLKFKFSCGYQTMLLSELRTFVNNGFNMKIETLLDFDLKNQFCNATLHINDTAAMSGGQIANLSRLPANSMLHLGNIPKDISRTYGAKIHPFVGCMHNLIINNELRNIYNEASEAVDIRECSSLSCLSDPCYNGGKCVNHGSDYVCSCSNGFLGNQCERSVCETNPCLYGGTCAQYPGSGFLCLCPLGKHGLYCEHNLEISRPSFSSTIEGLSSYIQYHMPVPSKWEVFEMRFKFQSNNMEQIALLAFIGQMGKHDPKSYHLAVTFVKGYLMLTWNMGQGPRRIFTPRPITDRGGRPHVVRVGRRGRTAWLSVDSRFNVTGNAPGSATKMDTSPYIYLGGHFSQNFELLPHDLPLHSGFAGCIWELWVGGGSPHELAGRAVGQCGVTQCHQRACGEGRGVCVHHTATFACMCNEGWFGPTCTVDHNPCDALHTQCQGFCVPSATGDHYCDCPYGKSGAYCEEELHPTDVLLTGARSYLKLRTRQVSSVRLALELDMKPLQERGIVIFIATPNFYTSLSMQGGLLEYRWKDRISNMVSVVRCSVITSMEQWHSIRAGRYGSKLYLWVDGTMNTDNMVAQTYPHSTDNATIYVGGMDDLSRLPIEMISGPPEPFTGCIRRLHINNIHIPLDKENIKASRNIADCDGGACGIDLCLHGGTCVTEADGRIGCRCPQHRTGPRCAAPAPCRPALCPAPGGRCIGARCVCATGWMGEACDTKINITTPQFNGDGMLLISEDKSKTNEMYNEHVSRPKRQIDYVSFNFTTAEPDQLLIWSELPEDFIGIGLEGGYLKIIWSLHAPIKQSSPVVSSNNKTGHVSMLLGKQGNIKVRQAGILADGEWHTIKLWLNPGNISFYIDEAVAYQEEPGIHNDIDIKANRILYIGGVPEGSKASKHNVFTKKFKGCIDNIITSSRHLPMRNYTELYGENVLTCRLFP